MDTGRRKVKLWCCTKCNYADVIPNGDVPYYCPYCDGEDTLQVWFKWRGYFDKMKALERSRRREELRQIVLQERREQREAGCPDEYLDEQTIYESWCSR